MGFEYHDNNVFFYMKDTPCKIKSGSYLIKSDDDYIVTSGQDPDNEMHNGQMNQVLAISGDGKSGTLTYRLGRQNSDVVDNWVNGRVKHENQSLGRKLRDGTSDAWFGNFAFIGTLTLELTGGSFLGTSETFVFENFLLAQCHINASAANPWLYGSSDSFQNSGVSKGAFSKIAGVHGMVGNFTTNMPNINTEYGAYQINILNIYLATQQPIK